MFVAPVPWTKIIREAPTPRRGEYISEDELVEITPKSVRLRKEVLQPGMRK
jgi:predicted membrane GTPase involved in stress response